MADHRIVQTASDLKTPVTERDHLQGPLAAPVVLLEYGDYECPDCLNAWPVAAQLRLDFGDRFAFVFRHFPVNSVHPHASAAAQAAEAAADQGKFWQMHDLLFSHQQDLASLDLTHLALQLGLEIYRFQGSLESDGHLRRIRDDIAGAQQSGVTGTPTFFINGRRYRGPADLPSLTAAIQAALTG